MSDTPVTLHIFNPETDYALAHGKRQYTAPLAVRKLRQSLAALPAIWAEPGDCILLLDEYVDTPYMRIAKERGIGIVSSASIESGRIDRVVPWGWNPDIAARLERLGIDSALMPDATALCRLRELAHRRTTIDFHRFVDSRISEGCVDNLPVELFEIQTVEAWLEHTVDSYLKAPWSSSGRGVLHTSTMSRSAVLAWAKGVIRSQGSVMAEVATSKTIDFASEWVCSGGKTVFSGLSVFRTDNRGGYSGNMVADCGVLKFEIGKHTAMLDDVVEVQRLAIDKFIAPYYNGCLGIDMLCDEAGRVNACVEVNLRHTMGFAAMSLYRLIRREMTFNPMTFNGL